MPRFQLKKSLILAVALLAAAPAVADQFVGIPGQDFADHYRAQRASMWCWAASIEMALSYAGIEVPQEEIVARTQGDGVNIGALPSEFVGSANGLFRTTSGEDALVSSQFLRGVPPVSVLYNHLRRGAPAILLYEREDGNGHAVVLTGMDVQFDGDQGLDVTAFHVFDPSLGASEQSTSAADGLAYRRIYEAIRTTDGLALPSGNIDGVVLVDSSRVADFADNAVAVGQ